MSLLNKIEKPLFVVNPEANERISLKKWKQIEYSLNKYNFEYDREFTKTRKESVELIKYDKKHRKIIMVGGDGTANAAVEGIMQNDSEKILGVIPTGIANDISKTFDIYSNPNKLCYNISRGGVKEVDVGEVNGKYFLGFASLGFDAMTLKERNRRCFLRGKLAYYISGLKAFSKYTSKKMTIKVNENEIDKNVFLMVISNIKHYAAGMKIAPYAEPDDGLLDLCLIEGESDLRIVLRNLSLVYSGKHINNPEVYYCQSKQLEVLTKEPVLWEIDGEFVGEDTYFKFNLANKKIKMLVQDKVIIVEENKTKILNPKI